MSLQMLPAPLGCDMFVLGKLTPIEFETINMALNAA